jgi:hypothetical protein
VCAVAFTAIVVVAEPWQNAAAREIEIVTEVVSITERNDPVMDLKGDVIFRPRPSYLVLEAITNAKLRLGLLRDSIAESLVRSATHVVVGDSLPPRTQHFVQRYYVPWGCVYVAGVRLPQFRGDGKPASINVGIPGSYVVVGERGVLRAMIDGVWETHGVDLKPGRHTVVVFERVSRPLLIWSGALKWPLPKTRGDRSKLFPHFLRRRTRHRNGVEACQDGIEYAALKEFRPNGDETPPQIVAQSGRRAQLLSESSNNGAEFFDRHDGIPSFS